MGYIHRSRLEVKQWCLRRECSRLQKARGYSTDCTRLERENNLSKSQVRWRLRTPTKVQRGYAFHTRRRQIYRTGGNLSDQAIISQLQINDPSTIRTYQTGKGPQKCKAIARAKMDCTKPWKSFRDLEFVLKRRKRSSLVTRRDRKTNSTKMIRSAQEGFHKRSTMNKVLIANNK